MPDSKTFYEKVAEIQQKLKAPKGQFNAFGKYKYRNCEDILEAVKPLLGDLILTINDEVVLIGERYYVKAKVELSSKDSTATTYAYARESASKKGMDEAQITGAASSYARKYALNGLFLIDDTKDADSQDNTDQVKKPTKEDLLEDLRKHVRPLTEKRKGEFLNEFKLSTMADVAKKGPAELNKLIDYFIK